MMRNSNLEFDGKKVTLRKLKLSDAGELYKNVNDKEIARWTLTIPYPYPEEDAIKFIRKTHYQIKRGKGYVFGIVLKETGKVIGAIALIKVDWTHKNAEAGYWMGRSYWNRGLMTEALELLLKFSFEQLELHRVYAHVFAENVNSKRVLEKNGFHMEGKMREAICKYEIWQDLLLYGILQPDYKKCASS
jgi:RimJ/RimL family protein N-acetyltransferase